MGGDVCGRGCTLGVPATSKSWLVEEFKRAGGKATFLRSLPENGGWLPHYRHSFNPLFRDGGAIPTLWAKADLTDTTLIATTASQRAGQVVVRAGSGIRRVQDLAGRRIGLFKSQNDDKIDFARATAQHGLLLVLELAGLSAEQVQWVDLADDDDQHMGGALYLFLRGTRSQSQGVFFARPPKQLIESLDLLFQGKPQLKPAEPAWEQGVLL